jgi:hypothetical protein
MKEDWLHIIRLKIPANINAIIKMTSPFGRRLGRPQAPVAEGGPSAFPTGGTDGTGSPGPGG